MLYLGCMDQNAQAQILNALLRQRELLDKHIQEIVDGMIRSTSQQESAPAKTAAKQSARRRISPAAKKRMAEATRKRWEQYRQAKAVASKKAPGTAQKPNSKKTAPKKSAATAKSA